MKVLRTSGKVLLVITLAALSAACVHMQPAVQGVQPASRVEQNDNVSYGPPETVTTLTGERLTESSGVVASRLSPGVYWTHNDSGDGPFIYAFDLSGRSRGVWRVTGASATDWEDIAAGPGPVPGRSYLYIGDIGDNQSAREDVVIYRIGEPSISEASSKSSRGKPLATERADAFHFRYPDAKHDAEALMIEPASGDVYVVTKVFPGRAVVYKGVAPLEGNGLRVLQRVGELQIPSLFGGAITGGDISPDGQRVALCDYFNGYEFVLPRTSRSFDEIWKQKPTVINIGKRKQGEGIAYRLDGRALITTSEGRNSPVLQVLRKV